MTTGAKPKLLGISKLGNVYLRKKLIHGARAALPTLSKAEIPLGGWLRGLLARAHVNTVVVALATKLARIICAVPRKDLHATAASDITGLTARAGAADAADTDPSDPACGPGAPRR